MYTAASTPCSPARVGLSSPRISQTCKAISDILPTLLGPPPRKEKKNYKKWCRVILSKTYHNIGLSFIFRHKTVLWWYFSDLIMKKYLFLMETDNKHYKHHSGLLFTLALPTLKRYVNNLASSFSLISSQKTGYPKTWQKPLHNLAIFTRLGFCEIVKLFTMRPNLTLRNIWPVQLCIITITQFRRLTL